MATAGSWTVAALGLGALALTATVCVVVLRAARQIHQVQRRTEQIVVANHKRASVWNHHLTEAVAGRGRGGAATRPASRVVTGANGSADKTHREAGLLVQSGIFDPDHYAALVGSVFETAEDAASHYLTLNAPRGLMPTPFIQAEALPQPVERDLKSGTVKSLLTFLQAAEAFDRPLSEIFDARYAEISSDAARVHPGGVLGAFLSSAVEDTSLPVASGSPVAGATVSDVQASLVTHARDFYAKAPSTRPREQDTWDHQDEARWIAALPESGEASTKVSVVMPVKNRAHIVASAINSVRRQTHARWELIVVDDGSTDDTVDVVRRLADEDPRVVLRSHDGHGVSAARNAGLAAATGEFVAFLDSDNQWVEHFLETCLRAMLKDDVNAAYAAVAIHTGNAVRYRAFEGGLDQLKLLNHIDLNVLVVRAALLDEALRFDVTLKRWVDHDFAIKVAAREVPTLLPFIGCEYDHSDEASDRITLTESEHWQWAVLGRHWVDWTRIENDDPVAGRLSVVIPTYNDSAMTVQAIDAVLADASADGLDVEIIVIDNGSHIEVGQAILAGAGASPHVAYRRLPRNLNFAIGCNAGVVEASGEYVLFLNNDTVVRRGALARLLEGIADPEVIGVQPLLVYGDETIQTAGTVFSTHDALPSHLLTGQPPADAARLGGVDLSAVTAAAMIMRRRDVVELRGFDPIYVNGMEDVDLCLRAGEKWSRPFRTVPDALVTHLESKTPGRGQNVDENRRIFLERWRGRLPGPEHEVYQAAGFLVAHVGTDGRDIPGPKPVVVRDPAAIRTRWGIKIASVPGLTGDRWGDTHFADSLRHAFERKGQEVVVHRHGTHTTPAAAFDDVVLAIRGLDRIRPMPGKTNVLWVISHPDKVSVEEVREFDLVFAASLSWAREMSALSGRPVEPLLQATDPERFHTQVPAVPLGRPLFVGGRHPGRDRPVVEGALREGVDVAVIGPGWGTALSDGVQLGQYVRNEDLAGYYRGASRVLADHWGTMSADGFIQNRLFDAVAAGARVVSDPVDGIDETFQGAVQCFDDSVELARLCSTEGLGAFPTDPEMEKIAAFVRENHSFERRAEVLIEAVEGVRA